MAEANVPIETYCSYAPADEPGMRLLEKHLSLLLRQRWLVLQNRSKIAVGKDTRLICDKWLEHARVILLLISADYCATPECYEIEFSRAMQRSQNEGIPVIPILLKPILLQETPFKRLKTLPSSETPGSKKFISQWRNQDDAYANVAAGLYQILLQEKPGLAESVGGSTAQTGSPPKPTFPHFVYSPSRQGNECSASFFLGAQEYTLHYTRRDNLTHQVLILTYNREELVREKVPELPSLKTFERSFPFQIAGLDGFLNFKMRAIIGIMSVNVKVAGVEIFSV